MGWVVKATPQMLYPRERDPAPLIYKARWNPGSVWMDAENLAPTGIRSLDRPVRSRSLYRLSSRGQHRLGHATIKHHTSTLRHGKVQKKFRIVFITITFLKLIRRARALLEKLTVPQPFKQLSAFIETRCFITAFT